jgi:Tfp pilus assembly protein PilX
VKKNLALRRGFKRRASEQGMTLLIAMIMLTVITLFVVSMVRLSNTNATIVGNMRAQKSVDAEAQQQIEIALNQFQFFEDVISSTGAWSNSATTYLSAADLWTSYKPTSATAAPAMQSTDLKIYKPWCQYYEPATGYSALSGVAPQDTYWDIKATAYDSKTGVSTEIHQGIQMRLPAGNCV